MFDLSILTVWLATHAPGKFGNPVVLWIAGLLVLAVLACWLVLRWRKPATSAEVADELGVKQAGLAKEVLVGKLRQGVDILTQVLRYLSTRREWRYASPWVMLLGEPGAGKSSIAASITDGRSEMLILRERQLTADGANWHFCSGGVIIDPDGALPVAEEGSREDKRWQQLLRAVDERRPERALDATVLAISARTLLTGDGDQLHDMAELCHRQLWQVQKSFEFVLPVYLVVTQIDAIKGYAEFWRNFPPRLRDVLWGWSNASLTDHEPPAVVARAVCNEVVGGLRQLQISLAANGANIDSADNFFLFPQFFSKLQPGLAAFLETLLKPSVHHANFYFRGVYFCGSEACEGDAPKGVCTKVDFANSLLRDKVFAESGLARPLQQSIWSRHRILRKLQYGLVAATLGMCIGLVSNATSVVQQVESMRSLVVNIKAKSGRMESGGTCLSFAAISRLLDEIGDLNSEANYAFIPISWIDHRLSREVGDLLARKSFDQHVMPSLKCMLEQEGVALGAVEIFELDASRNTTQTVDMLVQQFDSYVQRVARFQANLGAFDKLAQGGSSTPLIQRARLFDQLLLDLYQIKPDKHVPSEKTAYFRSLAAISFSERPAIDKEFREKIGLKMQKNGEFLYEEISSRVELGRKVIVNLAGEAPDIADNLVLLQDWVNWINVNWIAEDNAKSPYAYVYRKILSDLDALQAEYGYGGNFSELRKKFDPETYRKNVLNQLVEQSVVPYGPLVNRVDGRYQLNATLARDDRTMTAIEKLPYMKLKPRATFICQPALTGWQDAQLKEIGQYVSDYKAFRLVTQMDPVQTPLSEVLVRAQLRAVLSDRLNEAQRTTLPPQLNASLDARFADQSTSFDKQHEQLGSLLATVFELGDPVFSRSLGYCLENYAQDMLRRIDQLTESSQLYEPKPADVSDMKRGDLMFRLGSASDQTDYLMHQRDRMGVLAGYAGPFVKFIEDKLAGAQVGSAEAATDVLGTSVRRWRSTMAELFKYQSGKDLSGSLGTLEGFFSNTLAVLDDVKCASALAKSNANVIGIDFFSQRQRELRNTSLLRCNNQREADAMLAYQTIAKRFNNELSGLYPFADTPDQKLSPAVAREFFGDYAKERVALRQQIKGLKGKHWQTITTFLDELDAVALLMELTLAAPEDARPLRMNVNFRAQRKQEKGAEELIEWSLRAAGQKITDRDASRELDYNWGESIELSLTWAMQSVWRPVHKSADAALPDLRNVTARFGESGEWALLRWMELHRSALNDSRQGKRTPVLEFVVPLSDSNARAGEARLYLELSFNATDAKGQTAQSVAWPKKWPRSAPSQW